MMYLLMRSNFLALTSLIWKFSCKEYISDLELGIAGFLDRFPPFLISPRGDLGTNSTQEDQEHKLKMATKNFQNAGGYQRGTRKNLTRKKRRKGLEQMELCKNRTCEADEAGR